MAADTAVNIKWLETLKTLQRNKYLMLKTKGF